MTQVDHTINGDTNESFKTAGNAIVKIHDAESRGELHVTLKPIDGGENEEWTWDNERVVELLINGHLIPRNGDATDYLIAQA